MLYIRIHRRTGNMRVLRDDEIEQWRQRILEAVTEKGFNFSGCIFVLYGTDYSDHPIQNAKKMAMALPEFQFNWRSYTVGKNGIACIFSPTAKGTSLALKSSDKSFSTTTLENDKVRFVDQILPVEEGSNADIDGAEHRAPLERDVRWQWQKQISPNEPKSWEDFGNESPNLSQQKLRYGIM